MPLKKYRQDPDEFLDYDVDWTGVLEDGETIVSSVWEKTGTCTLSDESSSTPRTKVFVSAIALGSLGQCVLTNRITTSNTPARVFERSFEVFGTSSAAA